MDSKGLKKFLDEYCDKRGTRTISPSTIGKIIKRYDLIFAPTKLGYFKKRTIKHNFFYPRCPGINGFIERAMNLLKRSADYKRVRFLMRQFVILTFFKSNYYIDRIDLL